MKLSVLVFIVAGLSLMFVADSALAVPAGGGDDGSTWQRWDFNTGDNPLAAEDGVNDFATGPVEATIAGSPSDDPTWSNGIWSGSVIKFTATIPNSPIVNPYKDVVIEIGFKGEISLCTITANDEIWSGLDREVSYEGDWTIVTDYYHIEPNPPFEHVCYVFNDLFGGSDQQLDYVMIDTICVPEPISVCLLVLGGLVLHRRKRT